MNAQSQASNLVDDFDRLSLNQLSKSSPSRLPPFQLKRSRNQTTSLLSSNGNDAKPTNSTTQNKQSNLAHVPCKFFKQGTCTAGSNCIFSHNPDPTSESSVCKYFLKGNCKFGSKCALLHTMSSFAPDGRKSLVGRAHGHPATHHPSTTTSSLAVGQASALNRPSMPVPVPVPVSASASASMSASASASYRSAALAGSLDFGPHVFPSSRDRASEALRYDGLSNSVDGRHRMDPFLSRDPFASSAPSYMSSLSFLEEQRRAKQTTGGTYATMDSFSGIRTSSSPRGDADFGASPFANSRSLFLYPSPSLGSSSVLSSSLSRLGHSYQQGLGRIPEDLHSRDLDISRSNSAYYHGADYSSHLLGGQDTDLNDAMLPSSLDELLTPTELHIRKTREHATHKAVGTPVSSLRGVGGLSPASESLRGYRSPLTVQPLDMAQSPFESLVLPQQHASNAWSSSSVPKSGHDWTEPLFDDEHNDQEQRTTTAINIPGGGKTQTLSSAAIAGLQDEDTTAGQPFLDSEHFSLFTNPLADDDGPFYMEDTEPAPSQDASSASAPLDHLADGSKNHSPSGQSTLASFEFSSLVSAQKPL